jgi:hypothetical protein
MLQLKLVDPDRDIRSLKVRKSAGMVKMKMAHDNSFHILNVVPCLGDLYIKLLVLCVIDTSKDIVKWCAPDLRIVWASTSLEQNQLLVNISLRTVLKDCTYTPSVGCSIKTDMMTPLPRGRSGCGLLLVDVPPYV